MAEACDHELPARVAGLPPDWKAQLDAAQATIARLGEPTDLAQRRSLAAAWRTVVQVEVWAAGLALQAGAPAAEAALRTLATLVGADRDAALRTELCQALFVIGQARRTQAPAERKVDADVEVIEAAISLASLPPVVDLVVVEGLTRLIKTGHFQVGEARERALSAGRDLLEAYSSTTDPAIAAAVANAVDQWSRMYHHGTPERESLTARRTELLAVARGSS